MVWVEQMCCLMGDDILKTGLRRKRQQEVQVEATGWAAASPAGVHMLDADGRRIAPKAWGRSGHIAPVRDA